MPPLDEFGNSPLWEALGRRFLHMDYLEADALSAKNKEFILSLFPSEAIYETLLTPEARAAIGEVGKDTVPVRRMLESIGFKFTNEIDPFDGGPHYRAHVNDIKVLKDIQKSFLAPAKESQLRDLIYNYMIIAKDQQDDFLVISANGNRISDNQIQINPDIFQTYKLQDKLEYWLYQY